MRVLQSRRVTNDHRAREQITWVSYKFQEHQYVHCPHFGLAENARPQEKVSCDNHALCRQWWLSYIRGVSERIFRVLRSNNLKVGFKPLNTLRARFPLPKDKRSALQSRCVVYKIGCSDCNFVYYGQTDRALATRIKEHRRAVRVGDNNSKISQHANQFGHSIDFDRATIVDKARDYHKRLFLEAWHSLRDRNVGNEHIDVPGIYSSLT